MHDCFKSMGEKGQHELIKTTFPSTHWARARRDLVRGIAFNDSSYVTSPLLYGKQVQDPCYKDWLGMMERCFCEKKKAKYPTYKDCTVSEDWLTFSNFQEWWEDNQVDGWCLDKDLLVAGNKHYSHETCVYAPTKINTFTIARDHDRGEYPLGVSLVKRSGLFRAACNNPFTGKQEFIDTFNTPEEAHIAWKCRKLQHVEPLCDMFPQLDHRVKPALIARYSL